QEMQETGIVPETGHPSLKGYLLEKGKSLGRGLVVEVNGRRLDLRAVSQDAIFTPGAGGLPTMKIGVVYRATPEDAGGSGLFDLRYRDENFPNRAGWKEVIAAGAPGETLVSSSVPDTDRSLQLANYPTDLLNSPPQTVEARVIFSRRGLPPVVAASAPQKPASPEQGRQERSGRPSATPAPKSEPSSPPPSGGNEAGRPNGRAAQPAEAAEPARTAVESVPHQANRQGTPRSAFTELVAARQLGFGMLLIALVVAAGLGAFHALEPGHGKTVVAAYLVGSRGTAWHALWLGLIVTASHTAGVYLLGFVTLYASRYVVPERLYPWLGVVSGLTVAGLGVVLFLRRYAGSAHGQAHAHTRGHGHDHSHEQPSHHHEADHTHVHGAHGHHHGRPGESISASELLALGVSGGIVPCPAALVVLLSAVSLHRVGFGLLLIVAFSVGLAAVLIVIGLLMVCARRFMSRFQGNGPMITRWLPLTSSAVMTLLGLGIAIQALMNAGILQVRL
ncbi:MAG TPA: hypothetical protein VLH58_00505, partial [Candidatus Methylomirabilis sp.]|nr:hypothetical protein [Candidatus Methylomirabilis sp.]